MRITDFPELIAPTGNDLLVTVDIANDLTKKVKLDNLPISLPALTALATKQATLVSGTNIKTVNSNSLLGAGDVAVQATLVSGTNIKTLNSVSLLGAGDIVLAATPSGVSGAIQFSNGSAFASDAANFFWDDTNNRLGVGTNAPATALHIVKTGAGATIRLTNIGASGSDIIGGNNFRIVNTSSGAALSTDGFWQSINNQIGINTNAQAATLHIRGSGSTSATTSLLVQNSAGTQTFKVEDGGLVQIGRTDFINWTFNSNTLTSSQYAFINSSSGSILSTGAISGGVHGNNDGGKVADSSISTSQVASAVLEVSSTTRGFLPPRMTTTQKNAIASPATGLVVMDITTLKLCVYNGSSWVDLH